MSKKIAFSFLLLSLLVTGCQMPGFTDVARTTTIVEPTPEVKPAEVAQVAATEVKHYSDWQMSFDYPGDLFLIQDVQGEGGYMETLSFIQWDPTQEVYIFTGPNIRLANFGDNGLSPEQQYAKDQSNDDGSPVEGFKEVTMSGAQGFEWFSAGGMCDSYTGLHFLIPARPDVAARFPEGFYGTFAPVSLCAGERYDEVLDLFEKTVRF